jgi:CRISPR-associated protein Cas5/CasD, subtype I-E/ECOLI
MHWLLFELAAPLASFGGVAPGQVRDTELLPSRSAVLGLLAAASGLERDDVAAQHALAEGLYIAARVSTGASLQHDYHTAQAPGQAALKGRPCRTRRDELSVEKDDLNTVLSDRYYYAGYAATIGVACRSGERLDGLEQVLRRPRFALYLGRKSCPPAWPVVPHRLQADTWARALAGYEDYALARIDRFRDFGADGWLRSCKGSYLHRVDEGVEPGELPGVKHLVVRRDHPLDTARRLFAEGRHWRIGPEQEVRP